MWRVIERNIDLALNFLDQMPEGVTLDGQQRQCQAHTRKGTPCQRDPLPGRDYCPSHKHLEETFESAEIPLAEARRRRSARSSARLPSIRRDRGPGGPGELVPGRTGSASAFRPGPFSLPARPARVATACCSASTWAAPSPTRSSSTERPSTAKAPTTPRDQSEACSSHGRGAGHRGPEPGAVEGFAHGMTVGTNALLEERGASTALVATAGFTTSSTSDARTARTSTGCARARRPLAPRACASARTNEVSAAGSRLRSMQPRRTTGRGRRRVRRRVGRDLSPFAHVDPAHEALAGAARPFRTFTCRRRTRCCAVSASTSAARPR